MHPYCRATYLPHFKTTCMRFPTDPKEASNGNNEKQRSPEEIKKEQTDPNLTELKGLTDPEEDLEPKDNDNPF
jgi:hypothetical protein